MKLFNFLRRLTARKEAVEKKTISYGDLFSHGLPMELFYKQVTRPYENIATVYKSVKALCDNVPQAKLAIYNKTTQEEVNEPRILALFANPNPKQSQNDFIQEWVGYYALYGEGFIKMVNSIGQMAGKGLPAQLFNLNPYQIKEIVDYQLNQLVGWKYGQIIFTPEEIVQTKDFNPYNFWRGMSPLKPIDDEMEIDQATLTFNNAFFKNNASAGLILSTEGNLSPEQKEQLKKALEAKYVGASNSFKSLILEKGLKPQDGGQHSHKEMEFIEQKRLMREEMYGMWRVPKSMLSITDDINYATFMGQMRVFWIYGLMPIMRKFEDSINKHIIQPYNPNLYLAFDYSNIPAFQEDFKERVATGEILSRMLFTGNEINKKLNLGFDKVGWRDKAYMPFSQVEVGEERELEETPPATPEEEEEKSAKMDIAWETKKAQFLKLFLRGQSGIEDKMERKISRYLMELRAKILKLSDDELKVLAINWQEQDSKLQKAMKPITLEGIRVGVAIAEATLGKKKSVDDAFDHQISSYLQIRMDKLAGINNTIKTRLENKLRDALTEQIAQGASLEMQVDAMKEAVRSFFNLSASRARLIARTESGGSVNGGSFLYYDSEGVEKKRWVTAHDELVRDSHRECEAEGAISMQNSFSNGLMYPQDMSNGDAGEVCNCRCSLLPVVE